MRYQHYLLKDEKMTSFESIWSNGTSKKLSLSCMESKGYSYMIYDRQEKKVFEA